jgi:hypothetical protein
VAPVYFACGATTPAPDWPSWRVALRLQLWRATGSTGAVLSGHKLELKVQACESSP